MIPCSQCLITPPIVHPPSESFPPLSSLRPREKNNIKKNQLLRIPLFHLLFFEKKELIHQMPHIYPVLGLPDIRRTFCFCSPSYSHQSYTVYGSAITQTHV